MKVCNLLILTLITLLSFSCASLEKISRHDFDSGYFKLKTPEARSTDIYVNLIEDSVTVYQTTLKGKSKVPDLPSSQGITISNIKPGSFLYNATFVKKSVDFDLSTVITKYRPTSSGVPNQLSYNINAIFYLGLRKDFYMIKSHLSPLKTCKSNIRQIGFDAGFFAGVATTPINTTVTNSQILLEYDGIVFQKGIAAFFTIERMSVGIALGFDNLLDKNSRVWVFNQKPWLGLILGIANF